METIIFNDNNLERSLINETTTKVRAVLINNKNEILIANYGGVYLFPGGTLEKNENIEDTLTREILEELGIKLTLENTKPNLLVEQLIMNYPKRNNGITNRLMATYYFIIYLDAILNKEKTSLTENEVNDNFTTYLYPINKVIELILNNQTNNPRNKYFSREIMSVLEIVKKDYIPDNIKLKKIKGKV